MVAFVLRPSMGKRCGAGRLAALSGRDRRLHGCLQSRRPLGGLRASSTGIVGDTIYALSSGQSAKAGVAVLRVSGPSSAACLRTLTRTNGAPLPSPRQAVLRSLHDPASNDLLDRALVLWFPSPKSFTGEDVLELHLHGSRAVVSGVSAVLGAVDDVRPAERGEFSRRAFENGKMDLTEVEGLADLIAAETSAQRRLALLQMGGSLRATYKRWRDQMKKFLAYAEAVIDFGEDVDENALNSLVPDIDALASEIELHITEKPRGEIIRSGLQVAILGPPNAGKSTLLNTLAQRPAAIVSPTAGTTRDVVQVQLDLAGYSVLVSDTAGLRADSADPIEKEGIRRASGVAENAHFAILLSDAREPDAARELMTVYVDSWRAENPDLEVVHVANKADLLQLPPTGDSIRTSADGHNRFSISCKTLDGVDDFIAFMESRIQCYFEDNDEPPAITRTRHRLHLQRCQKALATFLDSHHELPLDMSAEELRIGCNELGKVTGEIEVEEVLDLVFSDFCIGK